jgi:hypothetical protein
MDPVYMIRDGFFDFQVKLINSIICIIVCITYKKVKKSNDYFWIFLTGSFFWILVETILQLTGARETPQAFLFGWEVPIYFQVLLQGISEGAWVAILGIMFGDLLRERKSRIWGSILLVAYLAYQIIDISLRGKPSKNVGGDVLSRRNMFTVPTIVFLTIMLFIDIIWIGRANKESRNRGAMMVGVILLIATVWTITQLLVHTRWIEIGQLSDLSRAPLGIEILALAYDIIIEIALAYLPYYAIPWMIMNWSHQRKEQRDTRDL